MPVQISKKRKFVQDGVFKAELNEFLTRELAEDGYSGVEVGPENLRWEGKEGGREEGRNEDGREGRGK